jgi:hydantoinase/carbamoylase family amidase
MDNTAINPSSVIENLKELRSLTGTADGAQRVAWTEEWDKARNWLKAKVADLPVSIDTDEAGNMWVTLQGKRKESVLIGGHLDSVPNGGWLDGSLNIVAGLEVLRALAAAGTPELTVHLVDWADEEGSRFGRSLFGSSAASGTLNVDAIRSLTDRNGIKLTGRYGLDLDSVKASGKRLSNVRAYVELHIEQGPVLESKGLALAAVLGTVGIRRHSITFTGQAAHAGTTPMEHRRDALAPAAKLALEIRNIAKRHGGVCTMGSLVCKPGISSAVVGTCEVLLEQRHLDAAALAAMVGEAKEASARFVEEEKVTAEWKLIWEIPPIPFHPELIDAADAAVNAVSGQSFRMASGALHDASEVSRAGVPTAMLFVQSLRGLSHTKEEDTKEEHLKQSVQALNELFRKTLRWAEAQ